MAVGGGIKINNIKVSGGADGATFVPSVDTQGNLSWSNNKGYRNPTTVNIKGKDGSDGKDGKTGAKLKNQQKIAEEPDGYVYRQLFDDGTTAEFTAPRGPQGEKGEKGDKGDRGDLQLGETAETAFAGDRGKAVEDGLSGKVDKTTDKQRLYGTNAAGEPFNWLFGAEKTPYTIMYRSGSGTASIADPVNPSNIANKKYVDDGLSRKVDKKTAADYQQATGNEVLIYGVSSDGNECVFKGSSSSTYTTFGTVPIRGTYGLLYSPDIPEASTNKKALTNRAYVDAQKVYRHNFNIESDNGMWGHIAFEVLSTKSTPLDWEDLRGRTTFGIDKVTDTNGTIDILKFDSTSNEATAYSRWFSDATISVYTFNDTEWPYITDTVTEL